MRLTIYPNTSQKRKLNKRSQERRWPSGSSCLAFENNLTSPETSLEPYSKSKTKYK
eukprot:c54677_g1_i1 orf=110-277(+)